MSFVTNSSALSCTVPVSPVGRGRVVVTLFGQSSVQPVMLDRMCTEGYFALPGAVCQPCPANAVCNRFFPAPLPMPGFYAVSTQQFVFQACTPPESCPGVNLQSIETSALSLNPFYLGNEVWRC